MGLTAERVDDSDSPVLLRPAESADIQPHAGSVAVRKLRAEVAEARALLPLQSDEALTEVWSPKERQAERRLAEAVRGKGRDQRKRSALAEVRRAGREQRAADRLARIEVSDRVWRQAAASARARLTDPDSRMAQLARVHRLTTVVLMAVALGGIAWASVNVQHNITGGHASVSDPLWWGAFLIDPLVSVPLVVLLAVRGAATRWGRSFGGWKVHAIEAGLLAVTTLLNSGPYLPVIGSEHDVSFATMLGHVIPPGMVAVAVVLQPLVGDFLASILVETTVDVDDAGRMSPDAAELIELLVRVRAAIDDGSLRAAEGSSWPSISSIQRYFAIGKQKAQAAHDALTRLG